MADHDGIRDEATTDGTTEATTMNAETMSPGTTETAVISTGSTERPTRRRGPDPLTLVVGLATLAMAVFAFVGEVPDLSGFDPRWLLAGGAALVGLMLLVGSLRGRPGGRRGGG